MYALHHFQIRLRIYEFTKRWAIDFPKSTLWNLLLLLLLPLAVRAEGLPARLWCIADLINKARTCSVENMQRQTCNGETGREGTITDQKYHVLGNDDGNFLKRQYTCSYSAQVTLHTRHRQTCMRLQKYNQYINPGSSDDPLTSCPMPSPDAAPMSGRATLSWRDVTSWMRLVSRVYLQRHIAVKVRRTMNPSHDSKKS